MYFTFKHFVWPSMLRLTPEWALPTFADLQSTMSNQRWASPLVLSTMPAIPLDSTIRRVWVHPPSCAAINRWILYGCPVLDFRGSVSPSTVSVFITAVPITKLFAWEEGDRGGHVLRETTSRGLCGLVCPSHSGTPCRSLLQEAVAPPARRLAHQSVVDATALYPYATPQPPTGLPPTASIRCLRRLSSRVALANSSLGALYPHWHHLQARPEC